MSMINFREYIAFHEASKEKKYKPEGEVGKYERINLPPEVIEDKWTQFITAYKAAQSKKDNEERAKTLTAPEGEERVWRPKTKGGKADVGEEGEEGPTPAQKRMGGGSKKLEEPYIQMRTRLNSLISDTFGFYTVVDGKKEYTDKNFTGELWKAANAAKRSMNSFVDTDLIFTTMLALMHTTPTGVFNPGSDDFKEINGMRSSSGVLPKEKQEEVVRRIIANAKNRAMDAIDLERTRAKGAADDAEAGAEFDPGEDVTKSGKQFLIGQLVGKRAKMMAIPFTMNLFAMMRKYIVDGEQTTLDMAKKYFTELKARAEREEGTILNQDDWERFFDTVKEERKSEDGKKLALQKLQFLSAQKQGKAREEGYATKREELLHKKWIGTVENKIKNDISDLEAKLSSEEYNGNQKRGFKERIEKANQALQILSNVLGKGEGQNWDLNKIQEFFKAKSTPILPKRAEQLRDYIKQMQKETPFGKDVLDVDDYESEWRAKGWEPTDTMEPGTLKGSKIMAAGKERREEEFELVDAQIEKDVAKVKELQKEDDERAAKGEPRMYIGGENLPASEHGDDIHLAGSGYLGDLRETPGKPLEPLKTLRKRLAALGYVAGYSPESRSKARFAAGAVAGAEGEVPSKTMRRAVQKYAPTDDLYIHGEKRPEEERNLPPGYGYEYKTIPGGTGRSYGLEAMPKTLMVKDYDSIMKMFPDPVMQKPPTEEEMLARKAKEEEEASFMRRTQLARERGLPFDVKKGQYFNPKTGEFIPLSPEEASFSPRKRRQIEIARRTGRELPPTTRTGAVEEKPDSIQPTYSSNLRDLQKRGLTPAFAGDTATAAQRASDEIKDRLEKERLARVGRMAKYGPLGLMRTAEESYFIPGRVSHSNKRSAGWKSLMEHLSYSRWAC